MWIPVPTLIAIWQVFLPGNRLALESHGPSLCCQVFAPLVEKCKKYGRAIRIGTNHGSLSDRIMSYYGDSPRGMVSAIILFCFCLRLTVFCKDCHQGKIGGAEQHSPAASQAPGSVKP